MSKPLIYTDLDGVLLDLSNVVKKVLEEKLGRLLPSPWCSSFEEAYGVSDNLLGYPNDPPSSTWARVYDLTAPAYPFARDFVEALRTRYRVVGLSHRVGERATAASRRDLLFARIELDDLIYVESSNAKLRYLGPGVTYLEDHPRYAANAADTGARVFLVSRCYNLKAADINYQRAFSLRELKDTLLTNVPEV